jgi:NADPH:quinone reductase-like Zn-dependent oxidoreductase
VDGVFPFERFEEAFARVAEGHTRGKVVIEVSAA